MRRADRLFQIIQFLRRRRCLTAEQLAEKLEVSQRTIYRDIADLLASGVPIDGEAGVGYMLSRHYDLPPLMFNLEELEALKLGAQMVGSWSDGELEAGATSALAKIESVLPNNLREAFSRSVLFAPPTQRKADEKELLLKLRRAIAEKRKIAFNYRREDGQGSSRVVRPLCLAFFAPFWLLTAWCELRVAFRNFRLDRIQGLELLDENFVEEPGRCLEDFLQMVTGGA